MNCPNKELLLLLKGMSFSSTQHIADNNSMGTHRVVALIQKISEKY